MANIHINYPESLERFFFFNDDQVLTADQLNQLIGHFDQEDRLTRTSGLGIGIICGLEVSENNSTIHLSKGAAITSAGDIIHVSTDRRFTHFQQVQDENTAASEDGGVRVLKLGDETSPTPMLRLYETPQQGALPLSDLGSRLAQYAVILYLDSHLKEPENCTDTNCDNAGITQVNDLYPMLIPLQYLSSAENSPNLRRSLPKAFVRNVDLAGGTLNNVQELINRYETAIAASHDSISQALQQIEERFSALLTVTFSGNSPVGIWRRRLRDISTRQNNTPHIQYVYAFFQDLADAVNDLWDAIADIPGACMPAQNLFPKYIMAGELAKAAGQRFANYRHYFIESPILNRGERRNQLPAFLLRRIEYMLAAFTPVPEVADNAASIRISPSRKSTARLGQRAIPFYYNISEDAPLHHFWNYEKSGLGMEDTLQGYRMREVSTLDEVRNPFRYTTHDHDFFRIEGLLGMNIEQARDRLEQLRAEHNLGFKVETIQIEDDLPKVLPPRRPMPFPWLNTMFLQMREELQSNLVLTENYTNSLKTTFDQDEGLSGRLANVREADGSEAYLNIRNAVNTDKENLNLRINNVRDQLYQPLNRFQSGFSTFRAEYNQVASIGDAIERKVAYSKQAVVTSPVQRLVLENNFNRFDHLVDLFKKRTEQLKKQYIFDRFFNQNPGLRHLGGVPDGGTLVLAYSAVTNRVVGDFALPYCCVVEVDEDDDHTPPPLNVRPLPGILFHPPVQLNRPFWLDKFDLAQSPRLADLPLQVSTLRADILRDSALLTQVNQQVSTLTTSTLNTMVANAVNMAVFPRQGLTTPGGAVVNPGLSAGSRAIVNDGLRAEVLEFESKSNILEQYLAIPEADRTPAIREEIRTLSAGLEATAPQLIMKAGAENLADTDAAAALEAIAVSMQKTGAVANYQAAAAPAATVFEGVTARDSAPAINSAAKLFTVRNVNFNVRR